MADDLWWSELEPHECVYRDKCEEQAERIRILELENAVLRNKDLKAIAPTLIELAKEVDEGAQHGEIDPHGYVSIQVWKVAKRAGIDKSTVSKHMKQAEQRKIIDKDVVRRRLPCPHVDRRTGEMRDYETETRIRADASLQDRLAELATYKAPEHLQRRHGGARPRCYFHPNAPVIKTTTWECSECHRRLDTEVKIITDEED